MNPRLLGPLAAALVLALTAPPVLAGGLYGTVATTGGETYTGAIRWDRNENFWDDALDASKKDLVQVEEAGGLDLKVFGLQVVKSTHHGETWMESQFSIPFGHIARLEPRENGRTRISLKNGEVLEVRNDADLGRGMRGVTVTPAGGEPVELEWDDLASVAFAPDPGDDRDGRRLYGTAETSAGTFTGYLVWDRDEAFTDDILDGTAAGRTRKVPFGDIASIEPLGPRSRVVLKSGDTLVMEGTNDVNEQNRGLIIDLEELGTAQVDWKHLHKVTFEPAPASPAYADFDGGRPLAGTVTTADGRTYSGGIVWDRDEARSWEALDGETGGVDFAILFARIDTIEKASPLSSRVRLRNGIEVVLSGSNDVDEHNKGILIHTADAGVVEVTWEDFRAAEFDRE